MRKEYTPEEILVAWERNENFYGRRANMEKIRLYQEVKADLIKLMEHCKEVLLVDGFDPNIREKHALLWTDFHPAAILDKEETAMLAAIIRKTDGMVISAIEGHVRISLDIKNIWDD